jgi:parvulin-like peptidyl-prolyl isomerase
MNGKLWGVTSFVVVFFAACVYSAFASSQSESNQGFDPIVAANAGHVITAAELQYIVDNAPPNIQSEIRMSDEGRFEIIASTLASKQILSNMQALKESADPDLFYRFRYAVLAAAKELDEERFQSLLQVPDLEELARERYRISKTDIAQVPERRVVSHILLLCTEECDREAKRLELEGLLGLLGQGASFADLAIEHSQDPGSRARGGRLSQPISQSDQRVDEQFRLGAFNLSRAGEVSSIVESRFGFHIIRLEEIISARIYSFEEVKVPLISEIEKRYRIDAYREYILTLGPEQDFTIDYDALDVVLGAIAQDEASAAESP